MTHGQCDTRPTVIAYLPSRKISLPCDWCWYQIRLLGNSWHMCEQLVQSRYLVPSRGTAGSPTHESQAASQHLHRTSRRVLFPVLWMTSCFPIMGPIATLRYRSSFAAMSYSSYNTSAVYRLTASRRAKTRRALHARGKRSRGGVVLSDASLLR